MENNQKQKSWYRKLKWLLIFFLIATAQIIFKLHLDDKQKNSAPLEKVSMELGIPVAIPGFELYTDKSKGLQVLFPEQPEVTSFEFSGYPVAHYKSTSIVDDNNFTQFSVTYTDAEIYNTESINTYLNNFTKGKIMGLGGDAKIITNETTHYKGFLAREYVIEYTSEGFKIKNKGIIFVANGDPIDLSVSYPATMDDEATHFSEFTKSFMLK